MKPYNQTIHSSKIIPPMQKKFFLHLTRNAAASTPVTYAASDTGIA